MPPPAAAGRPGARTCAPPEDGTEIEGEDFAPGRLVGRRALRRDLHPVPLRRRRPGGTGTRRCVFEECVLTGVRMGGARHLGSAFLSCRFDRARLFDVVWEGCKLTGSQFPGADVRPMTSTGSDWSYTSLRGADLVGARICPGSASGRPTSPTPTCASATSPAPTWTGPGCSRRSCAARDLRGASMDEVNWRGFDLNRPGIAGARVAVRRAVGARRLRLISASVGVSIAFGGEQARARRRRCRTRRSAAKKSTASSRRSGDQHAAVAARFTAFATRPRSG